MRTPRAHYSKKKIYRILPVSIQKTLVISPCSYTLTTPNHPNRSQQKRLMYELFAFYGNGCGKQKTDFMVTCKTIKDPFSTLYVQIWMMLCWCLRVGNPTVLMAYLMCSECAMVYIYMRLARAIYSRKKPARDFLEGTL